MLGRSGSSEAVIARNLVVNARGGPRLTFLLTTQFVTDEMGDLGHATLRSHPARAETPKSGFRVIVRALPNFVQMRARSGSFRHISTNMPLLVSVWVISSQRFYFSLPLPHILADFVYRSIAPCPAQSKWPNMGQRPNVASPAEWDQRQLFA